MVNRKEIKKQAKQQFFKDKEEKKQRKIQLSKMESTERKTAICSDKQEKKKAKRQRKATIKAMPKGERKIAKLQDKYYKKLNTRPRRYVIWGVVFLLFIYVVVTFGPLLGDIMDLMAVEAITNTPQAIEALAYGDMVAQEISDEGIVLLKNQANLLPLQEKTINVFGLSAMNFRLGGGGSGGSDQSRSVDFFQGLTNAGISYNQDLYDYYSIQNGDEEKSTGMGQVLDMFMGKETVIEPSIEYLTDDIVQSAKDYSENALIVLTSSSVEAADAKPDDLKLSENQAALIEKVANNFDNVIIVVNAGNARELGFLDEYPSIKSALWVGTPGSKGANSLGKILAGQVNPSGRLTDTYVYDIDSHPANINFGDYEYNNIAGMSFLNYDEGIYIGYRFFETYYKDDEASYKEAVQYPFGYGLSYTDFKWEVEQYDFDMDTISMDIKVTNIGDMAGKDVVQAYFAAPYYAGGIEKSAIELGGYAKTSLLEPNQSETLTISFATRDMSSYDMNDKQAFVLEKGTYDIYVSKNVHNQITALSYDVAETIVYDKDEATGTKITNQFDYANGGLKYLSRNDWDGTYPDISDMIYDAPDDVVDSFYAKPAKVEGTAPTTGAENGIVLADLKGLDYDDPEWDKYLDQFTIDEMNILINNGGWRTVGFERLGLPESVLLDGPAGINNFFKATTAASYPTEVVIASTFNDELAYKMGEAIGMEANAYGVNGWYAPAMNVHRSPLGGRNFEYFSEDPLLSGLISANMIRGAQSKDILVFIKHFALNEQEINARSGVMVWANEQAIRELYLRPFEISVKEGKATGVMSSFIHIGHKWSGGNPELLQNVLRDEWGFVGVVSTDAVLGGFMDLNLAVRSGNDLMLSPVPTFNERYFDKLYKDDPVGITQGVRECTHNICYAIVEYTNLLDN